VYAKTDKAAHASTALLRWLPSYPRISR
jgi:hypothetical protein